MSAGATLRNRAREYAKSMQRLACWPKTLSDKGKGLVRLPPVFLTGDGVAKDQGLRNLTAMVRVLADYEEKRSSGELKLADLPELFVKYGGATTKKPSMRTVHNWLQQVAFAIRAAEVNNAIDKGIAPEEVACQVCDTLFGEDDGIVFIAKSDNPNEYKPLRYATVSAKREWLRQEAQQCASGERFGADITPEEWAQFGIGGHISTAYDEFISGIETMARTAGTHDKAGEYESADEVDSRLSSLFQSLKGLTQFHAIPETNQ